MKTDVSIKRPTLNQVRKAYHTDLQCVGLRVLDGAAHSSQPALWISMMLDVIRDSYHPREVTYLTEFIMHHADLRGLLAWETGLAVVR